MKNVTLFICLFIISFYIVNADDNFSELLAEPKNIEEKNFFPALLGGLFVNTMFHLGGRAFGFDFSQTDLDSIKTNLSSSWVWDDDHFLFNNPGHPYQGGLYHTAARSNGFSFYESIIFNAFGSITWELFGETDIPSINDLFVTVYGGLAFGEIMHRLYLEVDSPLAFLISPMDAINNLLFKKHPTRTNNLYYFSAFTGVAWISSNKLPGNQFSRYADERITDELFTGNFGFDIVYGNPYIQSSKIPFEHFEMKFQFGGSLFTKLWLDWTILIDGYLLSYNLLDTEKTSLSNGISLHYDLITGSNTNFASHSLTYTLKWQYNFTNTQFSLKYHLGWILFGSSQYYPDNYIDNSTFYLGENINNFGTGINTKLSLSVSNQNIGNFRLLLFPNFLYIFAGQNQNIKGWELFNLLQFEYWYNITERFSIGLNNSFYLKNGHYGNNMDTIETADRILIFAKWTFTNKGN